MTEIFKTKSNLNPPFMKDIFVERNISYSLRHGTYAQLPKVRTTSFGVQTISYLGNKLWQLLQQEMKQSNTLPIFKRRIKCWNGDKCNCRLCKTYIPQVGFLTGWMSVGPSREDGAAPCCCLGWRVRCVGCPPHDAGTGLRGSFPVVRCMRLGVPSHGVHAILFGVVCVASGLIGNVRLFCFVFIL